MKIGDKFIAEKFEHKPNDVGFVEGMELYVGKTCELISIGYSNNGYDLYEVRFNNGETWYWDKDSLKPV